MFVSLEFQGPGVEFQDLMLSLINTQISRLFVAALCRCVCAGWGLGVRPRAGAVGSPAAPRAARPAAPRPEPLLRLDPDRASPEPLLEGHGSDRRDAAADDQVVPPVPVRRRLDRVRHLLLDAALPDVHCAPVSALLRHAGTGGLDLCRFKVPAWSFWRPLVFCLHFVVT